MPDVFNHNIETVSRLYKNIRPGAIYKESLNLLKSVKSYNSEYFHKIRINGWFRRDFR